MVLGISISCACFSDRRALSRAAEVAVQVLLGAVALRPPVATPGTGVAPKEARPYPSEEGEHSSAGQAHPKEAPSPEAGLSSSSSGSLTFLAPGTGFVEDEIFPRIWEWGWFLFLPPGHLLLGRRFITSQDQDWAVGSLPWSLPLELANHGLCHIQPLPLWQ